jgi:hypothetical protein
VLSLVNVVTVTHIKYQIVLIDSRQHRIKYHVHGVGFPPTSSDQWQRDSATARQRDSVTARQRDSVAARQRDKVRSSKPNNPYRSGNTGQTVLTCS